MLEQPAAVVEDEVRELVRRRRIDPHTGSPAEIRALIDEVIGEYERRVQSTDLPRIEDRKRVAKIVLDRVAGLGPLQEFMDDPQVEEIWVNDPGRVFVARDGKHILTNVVLDTQTIGELIERMLRASGRRLDLSTPFVDATLAGGARLHVAIPDITRQHCAVNIRKFVLRAHRLEELVRLGSLPPSAAKFLAGAVEAGLNIVVSGGTQSGKTTMLNCLASAVPSQHRVITCEEVFELQIPLPDVVAMQTRQHNLEGRGAVDLRRLIVEALRMRPDRIIVGEVRQKEAFDLLIALNSGLPGMTSVHANSATEALTKLLTLPLLAGENVVERFVAPTLAGAIDLIVHLENRNGIRRTAQILAVTGRTENSLVETASIWETKERGLQWTGQYPPHLDRFSAAGINLGDLLR
jgi:pilus assembly protein CpaF